MLCVKRIQDWLFLAFVIVSVQVCNADAADSTQVQMITVTGVLQKQGITTYMYGDYVVIDHKSRTRYAIRKGKLSLERFVGRKVTIRGMPIKGYPVDFGPVYIELHSVVLAPENR